MKRFVINLKTDHQRKERTYRELCHAYYLLNLEPVIFFDAIHDKVGYKGISMSFKKLIIENYEEPMIHVFEDDVKFTSKRSRKIFEDNMKALPADWDIYLGGSYSHVVKEDLGNLLKIENFRSLHCAVIKKSAYDMFLSHDWTASNYNNIDAWVAMKKPNVYLCNPQIAIQYNGYSHNQGGKVNYDHYLTDKNILYES